MLPVGIVDLKSLLRVTFPEPVQNGRQFIGVDSDDYRYCDHAR